LPVPAGKPFPHLNDAAEFQATTKRVTLAFRMLGFAIMALAGLLVAGLAAFMIYR
jgi:hypothetical protein